MLCYNCGFKFTTGDVKNCPLCGMKFAVKCKACQHSNPLYSKFCGNCGELLFKTEARDSKGNLEELSENRKNVAVVFADVSGFTALSEKMDPEEVREIINECFEYITKPIYEFEGTIDKYIGDCIMILFGAKYSHRDDPKRAVACSIKLLQLIKDFSKERLSSRGVTLDLSIGINYGLVVTGSVGNLFDKDYTVMGDVVNTAQRLQSNAGKGVIMVSESVYRDTLESVHFSGEKELKVKNKEHLVKCYIVEGMKNEYNFKEILLVERDRELDTFKSIYDKTESTHSITVLGEAGIGKTILVKKFLEHLKNETKKVWVDCNAFYQNRVYHVMSGILLSLMNMSSEVTNKAKKITLISYIDHLLHEYSSEFKEKNYNFLCLVLNIEKSPEFQNILNSMNYSDIEREIFEQLSVFLTNYCKKYDVVFVIDDLHYGDSSSISLLAKLLVSLQEVKSLFILTTRTPPEELKPNDINTVIYLNKLSPSGINLLACKVFDCNSISDSFLETIIKYTGSNPLLVKEYISVTKRKAMFTMTNGIADLTNEAVMKIPDTVENIILSTISEFNVHTTRLLEVASAMGKDFAFSLVSDFFENSTVDQSTLSEPLELGIISLKDTYTSAGQVEKIYIFNQDFVREVIYNSILNKTKKQIHTKIAEIIEAKYPMDLESYYEVLCIHFEKAGRLKKSADYHLKTALKNKESFNLKSALDYFNKFLALEIHQNKELPEPRVIQANIHVANIYIIMADYNAAMEQLNNALDHASIKDDIYTIKVMIANIYKEKALYDKALDILSEVEESIHPEISVYGQLLQLKCNILRMMGRPEALELSEKSEEILLKTKDYDNLSETMRQAGIIYFLKGDAHNASYYFEKAYNYAEKNNNLRAQSRVAGNLGVIFYTLGMVSKASIFFNRALETAKKISNLQTYISANINLGILYMEGGAFNKSEVLFKEALSDSQKVNLIQQTAVEYINLGDLMYEKGNIEESLIFYNKSLQVSTLHKMPVEEGFVYTSIAKLHLYTKDYDKVPDLLNKAYKIITSAKGITYITDYYRCESKYELAIGNAERAQEICEKAISAAVESKNNMKKLKGLRLKGNIMMYFKNVDEALNLYSEAINLSLQMESDYETAKGYYRRYQAHRAIGKNEEAYKDLLKAKDHIGKVDNCRWTVVIEKEQLVD